MAIQVQPLTVAVVRSLPLAGAGRRYFVQDQHDSKFGIRVGARKKTFVTWVGAKGNALTVATVGEVTLKEARQLAQERRAQESKRPAGPGTLEDAITKTVGILRRKGRRAGTIGAYEVDLRAHLSDWLDKPLRYITPERVLGKHAELSIKRPRSGQKGDRGKYRGGPVLADGIMRLLSRVMNASLVEPNPVRALSQAGAWNNAKGKGTEVAPDSLPATYSAILSLADARGRDLLLLALYTGLRSHEARCLAWRQVDFAKATITIPASVAKNGQELVIPMSRQVIAILSQRRLDNELAMTDRSDPRLEYVFPSAVRGGVKPYMDNARCQYTAASKAGGAKFTTHSLRHTFVSQAERADISYAKQKYLVNHRESNITQHYQHLSVEDVREASQRVADQIDAAACVTPTAFDSLFNARAPHERH